METMAASAANRPSVVITGAAGYIGRATVRRFLAGGWRVIALSRKDPSVRGVEYVQWSLGSNSTVTTLKPDVVVHLASATMTSRPGYHSARADLKGLAKLLAECRSIGAKTPRFLFISSQSAKSDASNLYGRVKYLQEKHLRGGFEIYVRPGLVFGVEDRGVFQMLARLLSLFPVWPAFRTAASFQPIHVDDLAEALFRCAVVEKPLSSYSLGQIDPMDFEDLLRAVARRNRSRQLILPLPKFMTSIARAFGRLGYVSKTSHGERLNGLLNLTPMETSQSLKALSLSLRRIAPAMRSPRYRNIRMAVALLSYVGSHRPQVRIIGIGPVKRLVRLYERDAIGELDFPTIMLNFPSLLRIAENPVDQSSPLFRALVGACWVYEMTPAGLARFHLHRERTLIGALLSLVVTLASELALIPVRLTLSRWLRVVHKPTALSDPHSP